VVSLTVCLSNNVLEPLTHEQFQILPDKHTVEATLPRVRCQTLYGCEIFKRAISLLSYLHGCSRNRRVNLWLRLPLPGHQPVTLFEEIGRVRR